MSAKELNITTITAKKFMSATPINTLIRRRRIESIDLLRGIVMIIMALDHVRDYFHRDAFLYDPTDLSQTSTFLFFTRFITHYCAPTFVFLAGISAYLYGIKRSKRELAYYLFTRGMWLILVELFIISLALTFNPTYPMFNLQVIWAIGVSMIVLSAIIFMKRQLILAIAILLIAAHNLFDSVHITGDGFSPYVWSLLHEPNSFAFGHLTVFVHYPVIPWIGVIALGYYFGAFYKAKYNAEKRKRVLLSVGIFLIALFILLRAINVYGDPVPFIKQQTNLFSLLSFINVTKYPPSLLYILITLGPAMIFLALSEKPLNALTKKISVYGRVPFFYYVIHRFLIHLFATIAAVISGHKWTDMILMTGVNHASELKGYGFNLFIVYIVWIGLVILLYPLCKWFDKYKRAHTLKKRWLTYL